MSWIDETKNPRKRKARLVVAVLGAGLLGVCLMASIIIVLSDPFLMALVGGAIAIVAVVSFLEWVIEPDKEDA